MAIRTRFTELVGIDLTTFHRRRNWSHELWMRLKRSCAVACRDSSA